MDSLLAVVNSWQSYKYKNGLDLYCIPGGQEKLLSVRDCTKCFKTLSELCWLSLDEYSTHIRSVHYIQRFSKDWIKSVCICEHWTKNYYCHHTEGLAVFKKKAAFLDVHT